MKRDIRAVLEGADVPARERRCPGPGLCGQAQDGPDPCAGCKLRAALQWRPELQSSYYAFFLAAYLEAFRPSPRELSWMDFEIYSLFLAAKAEYESEAAGKYWKKAEKKISWQGPG
ncbi:MAG: hypothetical protein JXQ83_15355 [Candidatus Glassbacteria bacterium]|nr:hypothetical protein [Candidatus Glassbacteria bacterium]